MNNYFRMLSDIKICALYALSFSRSLSFAQSFALGLLFNGSRFSTHCYWAFWRVEWNWLSPELILLQTFCTEKTNNRRSLWKISQFDVYSTFLHFRVSEISLTKKNWSEPIFLFSVIAFSVLIHMHVQTKRPMERKWVEK